MAIAPKLAGPGGPVQDPERKLIDVGDHADRDHGREGRLVLVAPGQVQAPGSARRLVVSAGLRPSLRLTRHSLHPACLTWTPELGRAKADVAAPAARGEHVVARGAHVPGVRVPGAAP